MLSAITSVLLLGIVPPEPPPPPSTPPGIEVLAVSAPSLLRETLNIPALSASGVLLLDAESGQELFSLAPDTPRPMASLTKLMTALLLLERHTGSEIVTIPAIADNIGGSTVNLQRGETFTLTSLMKALLLPSANDAAYALAVFDGGSVGAFVRSMNDRAAALGLRHTHFANPAGLDNEEQYASPRDIGWLALAALKSSRFSTLVSTTSARISSLEGRQFDVRNTNELLHTDPRVLGVKTGTTSKAGECLVVLFTEAKRRYLLVLLGSKERYTDSLKVMQAVSDAA